MALPPMALPPIALPPKALTLSNLQNFFLQKHYALHIRGTIINHHQFGAEIVGENLICDRRVLKPAAVGLFLDRPITINQKTNDITIQDIILI